MREEPVDQPSGRVVPRRRRLEALQEARSTRRTLAVWGLSFVLALLVVSSVIGENGYLASLRVRHEQRALQVELARWRTESARLQKEAERLRTDPSALEEAARGQLGLVRPGETLIIVRDADPRPAPAR